MMKLSGLNVLTGSQEKASQKTAGKAWFDLPPQTITPKIEKDLCLLKLRSAIDLKGTTRRVIQNPKHCSSISWQVYLSGMKIVSTSYFFTVRLTRKERKEGTIAAELLSDRTLADYSKEKKKKSSIPMCPIWVHFIYICEGIEEKQGLQWQRNAS
ncbi:hypothetical protein CMV_022856 [Castanea mollissima]|uniref:Fcf2 pre-rRNA processing C-terminal domain-containing protein n=1 Tax=Castanea mollissima TaxID=60419 RepID=A0A8J4QIR4_9ROSI|nr:hypothetical protein CMV_022856 [Castanea mollissima]